MFLSDTAALILRLREIVDRPLLQPPGRRRYGLQLPHPERRGVRLPNADQQGSRSRRDWGFVLFLATSIVVFWVPLKNLFSFSLSRDYASHLILVVPVSASLIYLKRNEIFSAMRTGIIPGSILFLIGGVLWWLAEKSAVSSVRDNQHSLVTLAIVVIWISGFIFCYGTRAFAVARFPLLFLLLLVPIPEIAIEKITFFLQAGSASVAYGLLRIFSVPVLKQGFILRMPNLDIEVAKQCSGIRSSLALLISVLILGHLVLRSGWRKALLVLSIVPILIFKNGVRIVAVSLLSIYVNRAFLHGWLHTSGGIVFYFLGLVILIPIVIALRKSESENWARDFQPPALAPGSVPGKVDRA
jgi:exosortase